MTLDTLFAIDEGALRRDPFGMGSAEATPQPGEAGDSSAGCQVNVGETERAVSIAAGAALGYAGMKVRGLTGLALMAGAGGLIHRGYTGHCALYQLIGRNTASAQTLSPEATSETSPA